MSLNMIQSSENYTKYAYFLGAKTAHKSCLVELPAWGSTHFPSSILVKMVSIGI